MPNLKEKSPMRKRLTCVPWVLLIVVTGVVIAQRRSQSHSAGPVPTGVEVAVANRGTGTDKHRENRLRGAG